MLCREFATELAVAPEPAQPSWSVPPAPSRRPGEPKRSAANPIKADRPRTEPKGAAKGAPSSKFVRGEAAVAQRVRGARLSAIIVVVAEPERTRGKVGAKLEGRQQRLRAGT